MPATGQPKPKQLKLGAFMRPVTIHTASWRYPGAWPDANFNFKHIKHLIQTLERGKFDAFFMADHLAVLNMPPDALKRSATVTSFEPMTLLSALAAVTEKIGLIATGSTTYDAPYHVARRFASLDHISGGRAGWNVVTTANPMASKNFGFDTQREHDERYERAKEFFDVVTSLWDSWADDAFIRDVENNVYSDLSKMHVLDHKGPELAVRGPLNIARPIQGWPVIVQAGLSEAGRQFAAERAEAVFTAANTLEDGQKFTADIKTRAEKAGRNPDHVVILPGCFVMIGELAEEAREKKAMLDSLVHSDSGIGTLGAQLGVDVSGFDLDKKLPEVPLTNAGRGGQAKVIQHARRTGMTVRQLAQWLGGSFGVLEMIGTPVMIADMMQEWLEKRGSDGFNMLFSHQPGGLEDFVNKVVPELQRRGIFRREYEGTTLRDHLGLPRPENEFFPRGSAG